MLIDAATAEAVFASFDSGQRIPTLAPAYVLADAARDGALTPTFWLHERGTSRLLHGFLFGRIPGTEYCDVQSPYGYGGPLTNDRSEDFLAEAWQAWRDDCASARIVCEFLRFHPVAENWRFYRGTIEFDRQTVLIDLTKPDLLASYATRARGVLKKAAKAGYTVSWLDAVEALKTFPEVYLAAMREIGADAMYFFPPAYFERVLAISSARCAVCLDEDRQVVAASLFFFGPELVEYHLSGATQEGRRQGAPTLLLHAAAEQGKANGCRGLYLGGGTSRAADDPLLFFKSSLSSERRDFCIGRHIHDTAAYAELERLFAEQRKAFPQRVLFYR
jgi:Uncharacterized protein involved in methicillin resistance